MAEPDENGQLTATEQFRNFDLNIDGTDEDGWKALASTLEGYVLRDGLAPAAGAATDEQGLAAFQLPCGLYLITTGLHTQNGLIYETAPCLTMVHAFDSDSGEWLYEVTVQPKFESAPEELLFDATYDKDHEMANYTGYHSDSGYQAGIRLCQLGGGIPEDYSPDASEIFDESFLDAAWEKLGA